MARVEAARPRIGCADADGKEVTEEEGDEHDDADEGQRLLVQFRDAGVGARFVQAALRDDGPVQLGNRAVGANHFSGVILFLFRKAQGFGVAQFLGQGLDLLDKMEFALRSSPGTKFLVSGCATMCP